jgi:hypothetical protein
LQEIAAGGLTDNLDGPHQRQMELPAGVQVGALASRAISTASRVWSNM